MEQTASSILLGKPLPPPPPASQAIVDVARRHGVSPLRQMREIWALRRGDGKINADEYHSTGVFDPSISMPDKKTFVGRTARNALNRRLSPPALTTLRKFVRDKVMYGALLTSLGVPTTRTQAVIHANRTFGEIKALRKPDEVLHFLTTEAQYPIFGKPCEGRQSVGSVLIASQNESSLTLGSGRIVEARAFVGEVFQEYAKGFVFQTAIEQHQVLSEIIGSVVGTLRIVTLRDKTGAKPFYAVWKLPAPSAMSDNFWQEGSMVAEISSSGTVERCKRGTGLNAEWITTHPVTGAKITGVKLPFWEEANHLATSAHMLFPEFGVFGWDIAIGTSGPLVVECNVNPAHELYQLATGQGLLTSDHKALLDAASSCSEHMLGEQ